MHYPINVLNFVCRCYRKCFFSRKLIFNRCWGTRTEVSLYVPSYTVNEHTTARGRVSITIERNWNHWTTRKSERNVLQTNRLETSICIDLHWNWNSQASLVGRFVENVLENPHEPYSSKLSCYKKMCVYVLDENSKSTQSQPSYFDYTVRIYNNVGSFQLFTQPTLTSYLISNNIYLLCSNIFLNKLSRRKHSCHFVLWSPVYFIYRTYSRTGPVA